MQISDITNCYLCGLELDSTSVSDHIIPDKLFPPNSPHRPQLQVHDKCNNQKSKEDEWFIKHLQLRSSFNPEAERELSKMIEDGIKEKPDAYIIGKKLHSYKLTKTIFNKVSWGLELDHKGQKLKQIELHKDDVSRFSQYVETMCRGLFIRNVPSSNPPVPELILRQNADLELRGKVDGFIKSIDGFIEASRSTHFGQIWGNRILYIGSRVAETPDKGFLFLQFYSQFCILAMFK